MKKKRKWSKSYIEYRRQYYENKKIGNTKNRAVVYSKYQYDRLKKEDGLTDRQILDSQTILHGKGAKTRAWKQYQKIKKGYKRGETVETETTMTVGRGEVEESFDELSYHYSLSGLLKDRNALHFIISYRINEGQDREKVLADYGY